MSSVFTETLRRVPRYAWILVAIVAVGFFMRTYRFHDWLEFKGDQVRDAQIVSDAVSGRSSWPLLGPVMGNSATQSGDQYRIGPMYYYFQIVSAEIFGNKPDSLAYPDVFFSMMTIPLLFVFLRTLFDRDVSLGLTGLYTFSFFAVRYSRFAWNSNLIPFFTLLFLLSIFEYEEKRENVGWLWVIALGIALGVGVQLHVILLTIFPVFAVVILLRSVSGYRALWRKWAVVLLLFVVLNAGQILSETRTGFANSRIFITYFSYSGDEVDREEKRPANLLNDVDCHIEGNFHMLTSLGRDSCGYYLEDLLSGETGKIFRSNGFRVALACSVLFSLAGYGLLAYRCICEDDTGKRRRFRMLAIYAGVSFMIMLPVIKAQVELRYFSFAFFMPFLFLGFLAEASMRRFPKSGRTIVLFIFLAILSTNATSLVSILTEFSRKTRLYSGSVVLDEMEPIVDYMIRHADGHSDLYLGGDSDLMNYAFSPLSYLSSRRGIRLIRAVNEDEAVSFGAASPSFYVNNKGQSAKSSEYARIGERIFVHSF